MAAILILGAAFAVYAWHAWEQLFEAEGPAAQRRLRAWTVKGLLVPLAVWAAINCGWVPGMPILLRDIALAKSRSGRWLGLLLESCVPVLLITCSCWAAVTLAWLMSEIAGLARNRLDFNRECLFWAAAFLPLAALAFYVVGTVGLGLVALAWQATVVHLTLPDAVTKKPPPFYSRAIAKIKFGKYGDAEEQVLAELEKHEDDFAGWMMLADLYANHFNDLPEADCTVRELCHQPNVKPVEISLALHRLADWQLKLGDDPVRARGALEELCRLLPGTHFDRMARQRINQLPPSREDLIEQRKPRLFRLPALSGEDGDRSGESRPGVDLRLAKAEAERCVERLKRNPNDALTRERFAIILAEQLGQPELGIEQLRLLLESPEELAGHSAERLAMIAAWQLKFQPETAIGKKTLERLVAQYPETPQAAAAQRRIRLLETEAEAKKTAESKPAPQQPIRLVHLQN